MSPWTALPMEESPRSNPFQPLPGEFGGQYLGLRFTFFYNPDKDEADLR